MIHMRIRASTAPTSSVHDDTRSWQEIVAPYARPDTKRAVFQLVDTVVPFLALVAALLYGVSCYGWAALPLALPAATLLVRLFMFQHDCGHGSFFKSRRANDLLGRVLGVLTLTPYAFWRRNHAIHHATSGNLDRRGVGAVLTLTVHEYLSLPRWRRFLYRIYRHPLVLFGIGPTYLFVIRQRIPMGSALRHRQSWVSILGTNGAIAAVMLALAVTVGPRSVLLGYLPVVLLASSVGVWLFYIQHQFEDAYWQADADWDFRAAALQGSSFYDLPRILDWLTGSIGFHHIHHLSSKIPNYRLRDCFEETPKLQSTKRLRLGESLKCAPLALWDEKRRKLVSFHAIDRTPERCGLVEPGGPSS